ncbi:MAG: hypothetical protein JWQ09_3337, partial [Segetibacter sp.]|nr:hypothetical protein [Segetibacter sp.]
MRELQHLFVTKQDYIYSMFLSKKWIFILISISGISFLVLLVIQFRWITKSIELDRQHFDDRMMVILNKIDGAFLSDKLFQKTYLSGSEETKDFVVVTNRRQTFEGIIHYKVDSVLEAEKAPLSASIIGRTGNSCYLMNFVPAELHNA